MKEKNASTQNSGSGMTRSPQVIVKFRPDVYLPYEDNLEEYIVEEGLAPWEELVEMFPGISIRRIYISIPPDRIQELEDRALKNYPDQERPHLLRYFRIESPPETDRAALAKTINEWEITELAYVPLSLETPPDKPGMSAALQAFQTHLDASPDSVGAEEAWITPNADGSGVQFIDIERGWILGHENFRTDPLDPNSSVFSIADLATSDNSTDNAIKSHGTSALGVVAAPDVGGQTIGIAFKASGRAVSTNRILPGGGIDLENVHEAIMIAAGFLNEGDVILLEAQAMDETTLDLWPVEVNDLEYNEIIVATGNNIVVIEPAGNGNGDPGRPNGTIGNSLDAYTDSVTGNHILNRDLLAEFRDSRAILVGSATWSVPHVRMAKTSNNSESNYGNRVDCYAWGEQILTAGGPDPNDYNSLFGSTSGASAILAGVALIVQGLAKSKGMGDNPVNETYRPETLREILGSFDPVTGQPWRRLPPDDDPPYGTKSNDPTTDLIGVMPDLLKIIDEYMSLGPDVYLRDFLGDTGEPHAGLISSSPDVIVRNSQVADPDSEFGQGSANQNVDGLGELVLNDGSGSDKYIYVRVINRGATPAKDVQVTVYWSEVSTLVAPPWQLVGSASLATSSGIPPGEMKVFEVVWQDTTSNPIPPTGHYCFVCLAGNVRDPFPPIPPSFATFDDYKAFIRQYNNITWCNFNVVEILPAPMPPEPDSGEGDESEDDEGQNLFSLPFLATGAKFEDVMMRLEVAGKLPEETQIWLAGPENLLAAMVDKSTKLENTNEKGVRKALLPLNDRGFLKNIGFPRNMRERMRLMVKLPDESRQLTHEIFIRQLYEDEEVGRITWRLVPKSGKGGLEALKKYLTPLNCLIYLLLFVAIVIIYMILRA